MSKWPIYAAGPGPVGGSGGPHLYADVAELIQMPDSPRARLFVEAAFLQQLTNYAFEIRDRHSTLYGDVQKAIEHIAKDLSAKALNMKFETEA
jgi:hypothetical protein